MVRFYFSHKGFKLRHYSSFSGTNPSLHYLFPQNFQITGKNDEKHSRNSFGLFAFISYRLEPLLFYRNPLCYLCKNKIRNTHKIHTHFKLGLCFIFRHDRLHNLLYFNRNLKPNGTFTKNFPGRPYKKEWIFIPPRF